MSQVCLYRYLVKPTLLIFFIFAAKPAFSQIYSPNVVFQGSKSLVLSAGADHLFGKGQLSTGEIISSGCDHGACFFNIMYKDQKVYSPIGENFDNLRVYEYYFGGDGDKELVVQVDQKKIDRNDQYTGETTNLYIYRYSKGMIQKLFEKEIITYRTILQKSYIEFYMPSGLDAIWHYYKGSFYQMIPFRFPAPQVR
jgi:hypothetical protein